MASLAELGRERRAESRESRRARHLPATKPPKLTPERQEQSSRLRPAASAPPRSSRMARHPRPRRNRLGAVRKPVIDEARAERIYAEVRALADSYVMPD